jgi:glutamate N-acetyltransferase/amino-acid N-acetyltransferase
VDAVSVTAAAGFTASGVSAGIKSSGGLDLALVLATDGPVNAAGVFTQNAAAAAPVAVSRRYLASGKARAVLINSGCANAGTGPQGLEDAETTTRSLAMLLGCRADEVLVCSTGPIGPRLPVSRIDAALPSLVSAASIAGGVDAAEAILTTDSATKTVVIEAEGYTIGGMAKGAGMLRPNLATMLAVLTTDAVVEVDVLRRTLSEAVESSFNSLNVDGSESTNDTVLVLASGRSGFRPDPDDFGKSLEEACRRLARAMADDAEGASKVVTIMVEGAVDASTARRLGRTVADSGLVRASFYGADPNWGRILAALGTAGVSPQTLDISYGSVGVARSGVALTFDDEAASAAMSGDFTVFITVGDGGGQAEVITTDLTPDYVRFNGERS